MFTDRENINSEEITFQPDPETEPTPYDHKVAVATDLYELLHAACVVGPAMQEYKLANGESLYDTSNSLRKTMIKVWKKYEDITSPDPNCSEMLQRCEFELISLCASLCSIFNFIDSLPNPDKLSSVYYQYIECKYEATKVYSRQDKLGLLLISPATNTISTTMAAVLSVACSCSDSVRSKFKAHQNRYLKSGQASRANPEVCDMDLLNV